MRVCIINHGLGTGGTDTFVVNSALGLAARGHDVTVLLALDPEGPVAFREEEVKAHGVTILRTSDLGGIRNKARHMLRLRKALREAGPFDVVHSNMEGFNGLNLAVAWAVGIKQRVSHAHSTQSQHAAIHGMSRRLIAYQKVMRWLIQQFSTQRLGCGNAAMAYMYGPNWHEDAYATVIHNGIDLSSFAPRHRHRQRVPEAPLQVLVVGRMHAAKNSLFIVDIVAQLAERNPNTHCTWVGDGSLRGEVDERIRALGVERHFTLEGARHDVPSFMRRSDIFLLPSLFEGLSIALVEAQTAGLPCFVSDTVSAESDCGLCVFVPLEESASFWAEVILDRYEAVAAAGADPELLDRFALDRMITSLERVYAI